MKTFVTLILLLFLVLCTVHVTAKRSKKKKGKDKQPEAPREKVTIEPYYYCQGCKRSVLLYSQRATKKFKEMQASQIPSGHGVEANDILDGICDDPALSKYVPSIRWSCFKLLETTENRTAFLKPWEGDSSASLTVSKGEVYDRIVEVCVDKFKACTAKHLRKADVAPKKRTICEACRILAEDMETVARLTVKDSVVADDLESICEEVGYFHKPYAWIETFCDEMMEENGGDIIETMKFRGKILKAGSFPDKPPGEQVCNELYDCSGGKRGADL